MVKKIGCLVLALIMVLAMTATAFAASEDMAGESGVIGEFQAKDTPDTPAKNASVIIYKEITAYNPEECTVNAPTITFNYTITHSAALAGKNIYDDESHHDPDDPATNAHVLTKEGIGTPTITGTGAGVLALVPGTNTLKASENGTANRFPLTVSFSGIDFTTEPGTGSGVYRYQIDETTTEVEKNVSNIKEGTGANTLYLDVYVDGTGAIYGYVLFTNNNDISALGEITDAQAATAAGKTEGFVGSKPHEGKYDAEADSAADKYYTFNLDVKKVVMNDQYTVTTKHKFPFTITLANTSVTANVLPIMTINDSTLATQTALTSGAIAGTWTPNIASGGMITYVGIPTGTTVTIKEKNDVTGVTYTAVSTNADTNAGSKNIYTNEDSNNAIVNCGATALSKATENHTSAANKVVTFTNTLLQISPTGITLRIAPYALILAAGIALLLISRRRRADKEEIV